MDLSISKVTSDYPYELLLLADETVESIDRYLFDSEVYVATLPGEEKPAGVFCLYPVDDGTIELKNIAVSEAHQGKGLGSLILNNIDRIAREQGYREIIVGTGDCGFDQIRFYEKNGFRKYGVRENFFLDLFDEPIYENGIQLKDMVMLKKEVSF